MTDHIEIVASPSTRTRLRAATLLLLVAVAWNSGAGTARAKATVGLDLDFASPVSTPWADAGWAFGARLGAELHIPLLVLNPEIGVTYASFNEDPRYHGSPEAFRGIVGGRLGIGEIFRVGVLSHLGIGHVDGAIDRRDAPLVEIDSTHNAFTWDLGAFLEATVFPVINVGVHCTYTQIVSTGGGVALQWLATGAHIQFVF